MKYFVFILLLFFVFVSEAYSSPFKKAYIAQVDATESSSEQKLTIKIKTVNTDIITVLFFDYQNKKFESLMEGSLNNIATIKTSDPQEIFSYKFFPVIISACPNNRWLPCTNKIIKLKDLIKNEQ